MFRFSQAMENGGKASLGAEPPQRETDQEYP